MFYLTPNDLILVAYIHSLCHSDPAFNSRYNITAMLGGEGVSLGPLIGPPDDEKRPKPKSSRAAARQIVAEFVSYLQVNKTLSPDLRPHYRISAPHTLARPKPLYTLPFLYFLLGQPNLTRHTLGLG